MKMIYFRFKLFQLPLYNTRVPLQSTRNLSKSLAHPLTQSSRLFKRNYNKTASFARISLANNSSNDNYARYAKLMMSTCHRNE